MIWNRLSGVYDLFETLYNGKVYKGVCAETSGIVSADDNVLECACGTGAISKYLAAKCKTLTATDYSDGMLIRARKKLSGFGNVVVSKADITALEYQDEAFDKVVAGNVIHLLDNPDKAMSELMRVCKKGGMVVVPTYINLRQCVMPKILKMLGVKFAHQFDLDSYKEFFLSMGFNDVEYTVVEGRMPCAIAYIKKV